MRSRRSGFTLVELMVVILTVSVLSAISINRYNQAVRRSKTQEPLRILHSLYVAMSAYYYENGVPYAPTSTTWMDENASLPGLSGWRLPQGKKRFRYLIFGADGGPGYRGIAYAIAIWYPPDIDHTLVSNQVEAGYSGGWWGGGYYLTYMALDLNGAIYGWAPDGQPLAIASGHPTP